MFPSNNMISLCDKSTRGKEREREKVLQFSLVKEKEIKLLVNEKEKK